MNTQALLVEILLSGFFAIACFVARAESNDIHGLAPQKLFVLTDRLERLRRSRWQWFAVVLLLFVLRKEMGAPIVAGAHGIGAIHCFMAYLHGFNAAEGQAIAHGEVLSRS